MASPQTLLIKRLNRTDISVGSVSDSDFGCDEYKKGKELQIPCPARER